MDNYTSTFVVKLIDLKNGEAYRETSICDDVGDGATWSALAQRFLEVLRGHGYVINPDRFFEAFNDHAQEVADAENESVQLDTPF